MRFQKMALKWQWVILLTLSAALSQSLAFAHLPAEFLIGPLLAAILLGVGEATIRVPAIAFQLAQGALGVAVGASISMEILPTLLNNWYVLLAAVLSTLAASGMLGWLIGRWNILPGTTGVWGSLPGASTAMVLMARTFGADARLVAVMQYLRMILVSLAAAVVAKIAVGSIGGTNEISNWFEPIDLVPLLSAILAALCGGVCAKVLRLPSPHFIGSFIVAVTLHLGAGVECQLPGWLLSLCYVAIGWAIGLDFTLTVLVHAYRALPQIVFMIASLMGVCGAVASGLVYGFGIEPLTAFLAMSPGGLESVAIIAAASNNVDLGFVMALQMTRLLVVLILGPALSKFVARHL